MLWMLFISSLWFCRLINECLVLFTYRSLCHCNQSPNFIIKICKIIVPPIFETQTFWVAADAWVGFLGTNCELWSILNSLPFDYSKLNFKCVTYVPNLQGFLLPFENNCEINSAQKIVTVFVAVETFVQIANWCNEHVCAVTSLIMQFETD